MTTTDEQVFIDPKPSEQPLTSQPGFNHWLLVGLVVVNLASGIVFLSTSWDNVMGSTLAAMCGW